MKVSDLLPLTARPTPAPSAPFAPERARQLPAEIVKAATRFVNMNASSGDLDFPQIDSGNNGITAGLLTGSAAAKTVEVIRAALRFESKRGSPNWNLLPDGCFDPRKQALLLTVGSEDEIRAHLAFVDLASGAISSRGTANVMGVCTGDVLPAGAVPKGAPPQILEMDLYELLKLYFADALELKTHDRHGGVDIFERSHDPAGV